MSDPAAVIVCFALPDEGRLFTAELRNGTLDGRPVSVVHTGVGDTPAGRGRLASHLAGHPPAAFVISAGYAGGLHPGLAVGDLVLSENRSSATLLEKARALLAGEPFRIGALLTTATAAESAAQKRKLHETTGALAVDMETAWIADLCAAAGRPLLSLRVVSDAAGLDFPVPAGVLYDAVRQRPRYVALPLWLAAHPGRIVPFARFVRGLTPARKRLTRALRTVLAGC